MELDFRSGRETEMTSGDISEFARKLLRTDSLKVDGVLQEVRDVLSEVIHEHDDPMSDYGCTTHTTERARALMAQLEVK
jgi:hypothetical protein